MSDFEHISNPFDRILRRIAEQNDYEYPQRDRVQGRLTVGPEVPAPEKPIEPGPYNGGPRRLNRRRGPIVERRLRRGLANRITVRPSGPLVEYRRRWRRA